jgi:hypothetical protein
MKRTRTASDNEYRDSKFDFLRVENVFLLKKARKAKEFFKKSQPQKTCNILNLWKMSLEMTRYFSCKHNSQIYKDQPSSRGGSFLLSLIAVIGRLRGHNFQLGWRSDSIYYNRREGERTSTSSEVDGSEQWNWGDEKQNNPSPHVHVYKAWCLD